MASKQQIAALFFILFICTKQNYGKPTSEALEMVKQCENNKKVEAVCQLCAKKTKSTIVYPMCCSNEEEVYSWCVDYINFGMYST